MVHEVIPTFPAKLRAELHAAADTWRLPYWDWAMQKPDWLDPSNPARYGPNVPELITLPKVEVRIATGVGAMDNPVWKFALQQPQGGSNIMKNYGINFVFTKDGVTEDVSTFKSCSANF